MGTVTDRDELRSDFFRREQYTIMKKDITSKADIESIVDLFYDKVKADEVLRFFFSDVVAIDWEKHLPKMCDFWENVLFYTGEYEGNPLEMHRKLHTKHPTTITHFNRWLQLFDETVDTLFAGENADKMKRHSKEIAKVMTQKISPL